MAIESEIAGLDPGWCQFCALDQGLPDFSGVRRMPLICSIPVSDARSILNQTSPSNWPIRAIPCCTWGRCMRLPLVIKRSFRFSKSYSRRTRSPQSTVSANSAALVGSPFPENAISTRRRASGGAFFSRSRPSWHRAGSAAIRLRVVQDQLAPGRRVSGWGPGNKHTPSCRHC